MANVKKFVYVSTEGSWNTNKDFILNEDGKWFKSIVFRKDTNEIYNRGVAYGLSTAVAARIKNLEDASAALDTFLKQTTNISAQDKKAIDIQTSTDEATGFVTYTIGTVVDGKTILNDETSGALKTGLKIKYCAASAHDSKPAHISLCDKDDTELSTVNVSDIVGNGVLDHTSYNKDTNILSLFFKQADGNLKEEQIDMKELIDINDIFIAEDSQKYMEVNNDASTATFGVKIKTMAETVYGDASVTGLVDAADVKKYIDTKSTDLAVSAAGDTYVDASVDAENNKKINVKADVQDVTGTKGVAGVYDTEGAQTAAPTHGTLVGVEGALADSAQSMGKVKDYVDGEVAIEAARADAHVLASIKALDKEETTAIANEHVTIKYSETDGIVSIDASTADIASAALLGSKTDASTAETAFGYIAKEAALRAQAIDALDVASNTVDGTNVHVQYKEEDGIVTIENVTEDYTSVTLTNTTSTSAAPTTDASIVIADGGKIAKGSDIEKVAAFAADKAKEAQNKVEKQIADLGGEQSDVDAGISVKVTTSAGQVSGVDVTIDPAQVAYGGEKNARTLVSGGDSSVMVGSAIGQIKSYVDAVVADNTSDLAVSASGDTFVDASVSLTDNKHINIKAQMSELTVGKEEGADSTLSGVATQLVNGSEIATKVASFVNARLSEEVDKLDSSVKSDSTNVNVEVVEENGKLKSITVSEDYATVSRTATSTGDAVFTVAEGDSEKLVKAKDIKTAVEYLEDIFGWEEL